MINVIVVDNPILNARLCSVCNPPELMAVSQISVMRSGCRVIQVIRIGRQTLMFCGSLKVMRRGAMFLSSGMVNEVLSFSSHWGPLFEIVKPAMKRTGVMRQKQLSAFLFK
jgi:hypothetical protein